MSEKQVIRIEPKIRNIINDENILKRMKKRVCAYARVSTDSSDQLNSYNAQIKEYTKRIKRNDNWDFVDMYADEGISGTSIKNRVSFQRMLEDARLGKIDLILTKSLSRFARNTVDCLSIVQELRSLNVEIIFEKENISSADTKIDFTLTIFSSIAQEESRNISENVKWGIRKRFKEGNVKINTTRFLGYDKDKNKNLIIDPEQAKTVKIIFNLYIAGLSYKAISTHLIENNFKNGRNEVIWHPSNVMRMLKNEKYMGDVLLQKNVTIDYLSHRSVTNTGQAPQYYIQNNHEPIIKREVFEIVQRLIKQRASKAGSSSYTNKYPLSGIVLCGECKRVLNRSYYNYRTKFERVVLTCKNTIKEKVDCSQKPIDSETLEMVCCDALKKLNITKPELISETINSIQHNFESNQIKNAITKLNNQINKTEDEINQLIELRISNKYFEDEEHLIKSFNVKKSHIDKLTKDKDNLEIKLARNYVNHQHIKDLEDYLNNNVILSRKALTLIIKKVIQLSSNEVILCVSDIDLSTKQFSKHLEKLKNYDSILDSNINNKSVGIKIKYKVIQYGDELL